MKLFSNIRFQPTRRHLSAFTLAEMMIASAIYLVVLVGVIVAIQIFAMRVYTLAATKLTATQGGRKALNQIRDDIREAKTLQVGSCTNNFGYSFKAVAGTNGAVGNALQVFFTTNVGVPYTTYYLQTNIANGQSSNNLMAYKVTSASSNLSVLTTYITNSIIFTAEDCYGNTVSNYLKNNQVFTVNFQYYQWEYPIAVIGGVGLNAYDYYQLRTKVCRRALD